MYASYRYVDFLSFLSMGKESTPRNSITPRPIVFLFLLDTDIHASSKKFTVWLGFAFRSLMSQFRRDFEPGEYVGRSISAGCSIRAPIADPIYHSVLSWSVCTYSRLQLCA